MRFCIYLTRRGLITSSQCVQVLATVCEQTPPFGRLAIREKALSLQQVAGLLHSVPERTIPLGELAVRAGLMDDLTRNRILELQRNETPSVQQVLVALGILAQRVVEREHERFLGSM
jgi:hypothetical protein